MKSYLSKEQVEKRGARRRRCSIYVTFGTGFQVETAQIVDYSDSGLRMQASSRSHLGDSIEILDSESPAFRSKRGRVIWQRMSDEGVREFGVHLAAENETLGSDSRLDRMWRAIQQIALEDAFA